MGRNTEAAIETASFPDIRMTAIAPAPEGVANATIESCGITFKLFAKVRDIETPRLERKRIGEHCTNFKKR